MKFKLQFAVEIDFQRLADRIGKPLILEAGLYLANKFRLKCRCNYGAEPVGIEKKAVFGDLTRNFA